MKNINNYKKILFLILILSLQLPTLGTALGKKNRSDLIFLDNLNKYTKKEIDEFEKIHNIKFPKLAKKLYTSKIDIRDLCFVSNKNISNQIIVDIQNSIVIDNNSPIKNSFLFGFKRNDSAGVFYIDDNYIWFCYGPDEELITFELID